jgi:hypothetical protein
MFKQTFYLISDRVKSNAIKALQDAPSGYIVTISEPRRSLDQNAHFHALISDIAKSGLKWAGKERSVEDWKALMVSAHAVATKEAGEVVPGIEGEFVAIRESSARMSVARATSLIEYTLAFCANHGIQINETRKSGWAA